jgi:hypothetical protein
MTINAWEFSDTVDERIVLEELLAAAKGYQAIIESVLGARA